MDKEVEIPDRREIVDGVLKFQKSVRQLINISKNKIIDIFLNLRNSGLKIPLDELKNMEFSDAVLIVKKIRNIEREKVLKRE